MKGKGSQDPRYRANIGVGMRVMIKEEGSPDLVPCYVNEILTRDAMNELGIMVSCDDGRVGRVRHIGTETTYMSSMDLIVNLETNIRNLIVTELSKNDPDWWENSINPKIRETVADKRQRGRQYKQILSIPDYDLIKEIYFSDLTVILLSKKNWKNHFEKIFLNKEALDVKMSELSQYRNLPAHSKELTEHIEKKIQVYYDDIMSLIESYCRGLSELK